jgi:putative ABC transport system permease protein
VLSLVLGEAVLITLLGGLLGLGLAVLAASALAPALSAFLPQFQVPASAVVRGIAFMLLLGIAAGLVPAVAAMRLQIVTALRRA